jgi:hypothetical protein
MAEVAVIGGGPAGLFAAEHLAPYARVTVYERMPSVGRKLLMAGRGGLNLTHSEPFEAFVAPYGEAAAWLRPHLEAFPPAALVAWAEGLDQPTFVGSSGRVFPRSLKASPLLRAWLARLDAAGVALRTRCEWLGFADDGALRFDGPEGRFETRPGATILALGGASWPRLGSDGGWTGRLGDVPLTPLRPANMGVDIAWSPVLQGFAGQPLKGLALSLAGRTVRGEAMVTGYGLEGGAVYALSAAIREAVARDGAAGLTLDLRPDQPAARLAERLARAPAGASLATRLRKALHLSPLETNLLREAHGRALPTDPAALAAAIKAAPLTVTGVQPLTRAISTAGGVALGALDEHLMLRARPGVFVAGEMLDWEAPTGGYLLQATFATGRAAAVGALQRLASRSSSHGQPQADPGDPS